MHFASSSVCRTHTHRASVQTTSTIPAQSNSSSQHNNNCNFTDSSHCSSLCLFFLAHSQQPQLAFRFSAKVHLAFQLNSISKGLNLLINFSKLSICKFLKICSSDLSSNINMVICIFFNKGFSGSSNSASSTTNRDLLIISRIQMLIGETLVAHTINITTKL